MERVGEHPVPAGPLAVRWLGYALDEQRAGITTRARILLENAGTAAWRSRGREGVQLAYHWLDPLGNPIVWDGTRSALPDVVRPGETVELESSLAAPRPPGSYRLAFDLVEEFRFWFQEIGSSPLELPVEVGSRIDERRLSVRVHGGNDPGVDLALAAQEEPIVTEDAVAVAHLVAGAIPGLVAPPPRRSSRGLRRGRRSHRVGVERRPARSRGLGAGGRPQPAVPGTLVASLAPRRRRARHASRPSRGVACRRPVRGPRCRQTSVAIRSSDRLKTQPPTARATSAATAV
jgi:hypothetical protein